MNVFVQEKGTTGLSADERAKVCNNGLRALQNWCILQKLVHFFFLNLDVSLLIFLQHAFYVQRHLDEV